MENKANDNVNKETSTGEKIWNVVRGTGTWTYRLRSILMAIPVTVAAILLAIQNIGRLPAEVGLSLDTSGEFTVMISRNLAVLGPLGITAVCLLMMFCSKRVFYPWLISIFSLILPIMLWITNVFPN